MRYSFAANRQPVGVANRWVSALLGLTAFILLFSSPAHAAVTVGATPGSHQVSPSGAFTYSIPIAVPPGTAGIEPKLSLAYNSQGGNGLLGMGWSLAGLSVIHRCPKTVVQDGVLGGVNYDANDRYCLDGQRLVAVSGADGTEYRTETESYSRIVSYGGQGSGPSWWKAWTKSGQIVEYGNTADSRIEAQGKTEVMLWALNKLSDTVGNYLTVSYIEDNPNGQFYPDRIDYTGNSTANKAPTSSVRFVYEARPDITPLYQAGSLTKNTVRLKSVQTYTGDNSLTRDYQLAYDLAAVTGRSRPIALVECTGVGVCLPGTALGWSEGGVGFSFLRNLPGASTSTSSYIDANQNIVTGDWNGDGKADLLHIHPNTDPQYSWIALSNGDGTFLFSRSLPGAATATNSYLPLVIGGGNYVLTGDWNGDGKTDLLSLDTNPDPQYSWVALSNGRLFTVFLR